MRSRVRVRAFIIIAIPDVFKCVGALQFYRCGFLGVRYLEATL